MRLSAIFALVAFALTLNAGEPEKRAGDPLKPDLGFHARFACSSETSISYAVYIPVQFATQPDRKLPVVFCQHPGGKPEGMVKGYGPWADRFGVLVTTASAAKPIKLPEAVKAAIDGEIATLSKDAAAAKDFALLTRLRTCINLEIDAGLDFNLGKVAFTAYEDLAKADPENRWCKQAAESGARIRSWWERKSPGSMARTTWRFWRKSETGQRMLH